MPTAGAPLYPAKTIAKLFNLTERRVQMLAKEGIIPKAERGKYELISSVQGYVKYLQERSHGQHDPGPTDLMVHKVRLTDALATAKELEVEQVKGDLIPANEVQDAWSKIVAATKSNMMALPMRLAPMLVAKTDLRETEDIIRDAVIAALGNLADEVVE